MDLISPSPEIVFEKSCRVLKIDPLSVPRSRHDLIVEGIFDFQIAFRSVKGEGNVINHIYEVAAPRNLLRKTHSASVSTRNLNSSLFILLGITTAVLDISTLGLLGIDSRSKKN